MFAGVQNDLVQAASRCSELSEENTLLRKQRQAPSLRPALGSSPRISAGRAHPSPQEDPFTEQVRLLKLLHCTRSAAYPNGVHGNVR